MSISCETYCCGRKAEYRRPFTIGRDGVSEYKCERCATKWGGLNKYSTVWEKLKVATFEGRKSVSPEEAEPKLKPQSKSCSFSINPNGREF